MNFYKIVSSFEKELTVIEKTEINSTDLSTKIIELCETKLTLLRKQVLLKGFNSQAEEIEFFKHIKPVILSTSLYHKCKLQYHFDLPPIDKSHQKKFILKEINNKKKFLNKHYDLSVYIDSGLTYSDQNYFIRTNVHTLARLKKYRYVDRDFNTNKDIILAKLIAYKKYKNFLKKEFYRVSGQFNNHKPPDLQNQLEWTASKSALVELIYALHFSNAINNGNCEIKQIAETFESIFNTQIGDIYKVFAEIKQRQKSPTKFLEELTLKLRDEIDKNYR